MERSGDASAGRARVARSSSHRRGPGGTIARLGACALLVLVGLFTTGDDERARADGGKAAVVRRFSPQGEVAEVRQVRATFSEPMVDFGDPSLAGPFDVRCAAEGNGRWVDDRSWVYDFKADVGPGTRCAFDLKPGTRTRGGGPVNGRTSFAFSTGGPAIVRNFPSANANDDDEASGPGIDEEQVFVLVLNGPAALDSVRAHAWCEISGIGERVPVRLVDGADRNDLLKRFSLVDRADRVVTLSCARRLPNGAKLELVWGRGIAAANATASAASTTPSNATATTPTTPPSGRAATPTPPPSPSPTTSSAPPTAKTSPSVASVAPPSSRTGSTSSPPDPAGALPVVTTVERRLSFDVRAEFTASFGCERENAQAACTPVRPVRVDFTAPIARALAERFVLRYADHGKTIERHPSFDPDNRSASVSQVEFRPPFAESAPFTIDAPKDLVDDAGRPLSNASLFPLASKTAAAPPLAKFAAAPFDILELETEPVLPITVRHVEAALDVKGVTIPGGPAVSTAASQGMVRTVDVDGASTDAAIVEWQRRVRRYHESRIPKKDIAAADLPPGIKPAPPERERVGPNRLGPAQQARVEAVDEDTVASRELSLLRRDPAAKALALPPSKDGDPRPFEVVGIPLPEPGFHIVEVESKRLGAALLGKPAPMYVRTTALVTNLGVHVKFGRRNSGVWVTTLDRAKPVAGAAVAISDCTGKRVWSGVTDGRGYASVPRAFPSTNDCDVSFGDDEHASANETGWFVSARKPIASGPYAGRIDMAFTWSSWNQGIESWRFNLPASYGSSDDTEAGSDPGGIVAHTVFDRTLFRAGQTVSMKHFLRREGLASLALVDAKDLPTEVVITHIGSDEEFTEDLTWRNGRDAETTFALPDDAKLGAYSVALRDGDRSYPSGGFRVEEFRLPVMRGRVEVRAGQDGPRQDFVKPAALSAGVSIAYTNGGSAAGLPVSVSAAIGPHVASFPGYDGYRFERSERVASEDVPYDDFVEQGPRFDRGEPGQRVVADKLRATLDRNGEARVDLKDLPGIDRPRDLAIEATYPDPNGEIQTLSQRVALWPAGVVVGVRADDWVSVRGKTAVKLVVLDLAGKPVSGAPLELRGVARSVRSIRKRMVGGFYAYDNQSESKELGVLCSGKSNAQGLLLCDVSLAEPGDVELVARVKDAAGNAAEASTTVWVTRQAELWFGGENQDRIDVLPEKTSYAPGEIARFQVRMPFRSATALVAIERDGILATQVVEIRGTDPSIAIRVEPDWAPNVFVSVLAVRGRIRDVPWYSFFTWGWKAPVDWWHAYRDEGRFYEPPTAMVDLGKPAFKYGIAAIRVDQSAHRLGVTVATDKPDYPVRSVAKATIRVTLPDGKPVPAGTEVAVAAVDEALLELLPNRSWDLLDAMIRERAYGVETATAQMQIIGKRHYGRKAAPPGGGGGVSPSRELFDTLLVWKPSVVLDANGSATVDVPLNDSLTSFRVVAVADAGTALFGTGRTTLRTRQDLQIVAGLPPLVREGDRYQAGITLRNTTKAAMDVDVTATTTASTGASAAASASAASAASAASDAAAKAAAGKGAAKAAPDAAGGPPPIALPAQRVHLDADASQAIAWPVTVPDDARTIAWRIDARASGASDSVKVAQKVVAAVPIAVQQATLTQLDRSFTMPVAAPADAVADARGVPRGGVSVGLRPKLADGLPGVRTWLLQYPYECLEQKASIALGLFDAERWSAVAKQIPLYLDADGLANYFPPRADDARLGSDVLTAYLLSASSEASRLGDFAIPDETLEKMENGLIAFVEGRIKRDLWTPFTSDARRQLDIRKLAAIEALSRTDKATPRMLQSLQILPNQWPTSAVLDWMAILKRMPSIPQRDARLAEADQIVRARLDYEGTRLDFSTEKDDFWYWLMASGDGNAARLLTLVVDDPAWKDDVPRLVVGMLQRQRQGHWLTTTANAWGVLAVNGFSKRFENQSVTGTTRALIADGPPSTLSWSARPAGGSLLLSWPVPGPARDATAPRTDLIVTQDGSGKPWLTVQSLAAVPRTKPFSAGYTITRTITAVERKDPSTWSRGDIVRVHLDVDAQADMTWVALSDPIPAGASVLGTGLGRDSQAAVNGEQRQGWTWPAYEEKSFEAYRAYYRFVPKGRFSTEYTIRLNNVGTFRLPPTRVEAMYAPEVFGEVPNATVDVKP